MVVLLPRITTIVGWGLPVGGCGLPVGGVNGPAGAVEPPPKTVVAGAEPIGAATRAMVGAVLAGRSVAMTRPPAATAAGFGSSTVSWRGYPSSPPALIGSGPGSAGTDGRAGRSTAIESSEDLRPVVVRGGSEITGAGRVSSGAILVGGTGAIDVAGVVGAISGAVEDTTTDDATTDDPTTDDPTTDDATTDDETTDDPTTDDETTDDPTTADAATDVVVDWIVGNGVIDDVVELVDPAVDKSGAVDDVDVGGEIDDVDTDG